MNAADNKQRDPTMDKLEINVNAEANKISVKNNGKGIPVVHHKEHNCYVPTLIFVFGDSVPAVKTLLNSMSLRF